MRIFFLFLGKEVNKWNVESFKKVNYLTGILVGYIRIKAYYYVARYRRHPFPGLSPD